MLGTNAPDDLVPKQLGRRVPRRLRTGQKEDVVRRLKVGMEQRPQLSFGHLAVRGKDWQKADPDPLHDEPPRLVYVLGQSAHLGAQPISSPQLSDQFDLVVAGQDEPLVLELVQPTYARAKIGVAARAESCWRSTSNGSYIRLPRTLLS